MFGPALSNDYDFSLVCPYTLSVVRSTYNVFFWGVMLRLYYRLSEVAPPPIFKITKFLL